MTRKIALAVCFWLAAALSSAADMSAGGKALARLDDDWSAAAQKKDLQKVASYYADDAIVYPPNEPAVAGRAAAEKVWGSYFASPDFSISWKATHADAAGNLGYTTGTYRNSYKGPDGKVAHEVGKYVCVWRKQKDGSWKAIHDTWNSDTK